VTKVTIGPSINETEDGFIRNKMKILIVEDKTAVAMMVYLLTSAGYEDDRRRALKLGAAAYISKLFELTGFVFRILSQAKPAQSHDNYKPTV